MARGEFCVANVAVPVGDGEPEVDTEGVVCIGGAEGPERDALSRFGL